MITDSLKTNNISVCCMQETEVLNDFPEDQLNYNGYTLELEQSIHKRRAGIYLSTTLKYIRRSDLERIIAPLSINLITN